MINVLSPLGVETTKVPTTDEEWQTLKAKMQNEGKGVLVFRDLDLSPQDLEAVLLKVAQVMGHRLLPYDRWPGQSPGLDGCPHLALSLGNYKARKENDHLVQGCAPGEQIGEYKPWPRR
jgi:hypothetical protein